MGFRVRVGPASVSSKGRVGVRLGPVSASTRGRHRQRPRGNSEGGCLAAALFLAILAVVVIAQAPGGSDHQHHRHLTAEEARHAITPAQFRAARIGTTEGRLVHGLRRQPQPRHAFADQLPNEPLGWPTCIYYNWAARPFGDVFRFCFRSGRLYAKARVINGSVR